MNRRGFLKGLAALAAIGVVPKGVLLEDAISPRSHKFVHADKTKWTHHSYALGFSVMDDQPVEVHRQVKELLAHAMNRALAPYKDRDDILWRRHAELNEERDYLTHETHYKIYARLNVPVRKKT